MRLIGLWSLATVAQVDGPLHDSGIISMLPRIPKQIRLSQTKITPVFILHGEISRLPQSGRLQPLFRYMSILTSF